MKPVYMSKKIWVGILSALAVPLATALNHPEWAPCFVAIAIALLAAIGAADWAKESTAAEIEADKEVQ